MREYSRWSMENKHSDSMASRKKIDRYTNWAVNTLLIVSVLYVSYYAIRVFALASFKVPTESMEPTIVPGDRLMVNKLAYGGRLFDLRKDSLVHGDIHRGLSISGPKRNDVVVFNMPYPDGWRMHIDFKKYFVKRCVALPGDTFVIERGRYRVRGVEEELGNVKAQKRLAKLTKERQRAESVGIAMLAFPYDTTLNWTIYDMGPLYLPKRGDVVEMTPQNFNNYVNVMRWEQSRQDIYMEEGVCHIGDSIITHYQFDDNYYFMCGDKCESSNDSRYWGIVPEDFIVGRVDRVWWSTKNDGRVNWSRIWEAL